jgi:hypothetical protein
MPSLFDDLKNEFGKSADLFSQKVAEFSEAAKGQVELLDLKKDRYLKYKELGELTFQMIFNEHIKNAEDDPRIKVLVHEIQVCNTKIAALEAAQQPKK